MQVPVFIAINLYQTSDAALHKRSSVHISFLDPDTSINSRLSSNISETLNHDWKPRQVNYVACCIRHSKSPEVLCMRCSHKCRWHSHGELGMCLGCSEKALAPGCQCHGHCTASSNGGN